MNDLQIHEIKSGEIIRRLPRRQDKQWDADFLLKREWLVTNGLGGFSSSTVGGVCTRKYHGMLVAALPSPLGRVVMLQNVSEEVRLPDDTSLELGGEETLKERLHMPAEGYLVDFRLEGGLPVWLFQIKDVVLEKRVLMPHLQNTVHISYRVLEGQQPVRLRLRPTMRVRSLEKHQAREEPDSYSMQAFGNRYEVVVSESIPRLRFFLYGREGSFNYLPGEEFTNVMYRVERARSGEYEDRLWNPGFFRVMVEEGDPATLVASTEVWDVLLALSPEEALRFESRRKQRLLAAAHSEIGGSASELVFAADQFIIAPVTRIADSARSRAAGDEIRSVIAGYHWFTDWGRDTMISLEGLTLATGRYREAGCILRTFAHYIQDGLIPNLFPEGQTDGLYHTADATLWFLHAMDRYLEFTRDRTTLSQLLPRFADIVEHHIRGTRFGIGMDTNDGLLQQGAAGYQLTWMDAKVDDWVVTPRRGKTVEINALWYNALRVLERWLRSEGFESHADIVAAHAELAFESFNRRFWYEQGGYLYDVIDGEQGDDSSLRPNQLFALSLPHPVLHPSQWSRVLDVVTEHLLTPYGLRTLSPDHKDYKKLYRGDVYARDAAYHQGTVWPWLIGPYIDAYLRVHGDSSKAHARQLLSGLIDQLNEGCVGSIGEVFDGDVPHDPEGCICQAWSVAEVLRCWLKTSER